MPAFPDDAGSVLEDRAAAIRIRHTAKEAGPAGVSAIVRGEGSPYACAGAGQAAEGATQGATPSPKD